MAGQLTGHSAVPYAARDRPHVMRGLLGLLLTLTIAACGNFTAPVPTPGTMDDVIAGLVLRGMTVHRLVSGNAGCPSSDLHSNAVMLEVAIDDRSATHAIYLFRWRRAGDYADSEPAFVDCVAEYQALNPSQTVSRVDSEPWRAYGPGWPADLGPRLVDALRAAGGD